MNHLGMTLQRAPRLPIDINNLTIRITREVNPNVNHDFRHLLIDLSLVSPKASQRMTPSYEYPAATFFSAFSFFM